MMSAACSPNLHGVGMLASACLAAGAAALRSCTMTAESIFTRSICGPGSPDASALTIDAASAHCAGCILLAAGLAGAAAFATLWLARAPDDRLGKSL